MGLSQSTDVGDVAHCEVKSDIAVSTRIAQCDLCFTFKLRNPDPSEAHITGPLLLLSDVVATWRRGTSLAVRIDHDKTNDFSATHPGEPAS